MGKEQCKQPICLTEQSACLNDFPKETRSSANLETSLFASFYSSHVLYVPHEAYSHVVSRGLHRRRLMWKASGAQGIWMDCQLPNGDVLLSYLDPIPPTYFFLLLKKRVEARVSPLLGLKTKEPPSFFLPLLPA